MAISFTGKKEAMPLVQEGKYEVTLNSEWSKTKSGDDYIKFIYTIRKDVEQNEQGRLVFDAAYKSKTTGDFPKSKFDAIFAGIPNAKLNFEDYDEVIQYLNDVNMIIEVGVEKADASNNLQNDRNIVKFWSNEPTVAGPIFKTPAEPVEDTSVQAGDLPF